MLAFWLYTPLILAALVWNLRNFSLAACAGSLVAGLLFWTLLEYVLHRFVFHRMAPHFDHHAHPSDAKYIFAPIWFSLAATVILWPLLSLAGGSWQRGALIEAGTIMGYIAYELLHLRIHSQAAGGPMLRALRKHHFYHHFADDTKCYGVVTNFWDRLFGSLPEYLAALPQRRS